MQPKPGISRGAWLGALISVLSFVALLFLLTSIAHSDGQAIACYGELDGMALYPGETHIGQAAALELQTWPSMAWFTSWKDDAFWLSTLWTPSDPWTGRPRLVMFYGQYSTPEVIVLVGDETVYDVTGWHPCGVAVISYQQYEDFRAFIEDSMLPDQHEGAAG